MEKVFTLVFILNSREAIDFRLGALHVLNLQSLTGADKVEKLISGMWLMNFY